jgi:hypothetical protein
MSPQLLYAKVHGWTGGANYWDAVARTHVHLKAMGVPERAAEYGRSELFARASASRKSPLPGGRLEFVRKRREEREAERAARRAERKAAFEERVAAREAERSARRTPAPAVTRVATPSRAPAATPAPAPTSLTDAERHMCRVRNPLDPRAEEARYLAVKTADLAPPRRVDALDQALAQIDDPKGLMRAFTHRTPELRAALNADLEVTPLVVEERAEPKIDEVALRKVARSLGRDPEELRKALTNRK